MNRKQIAKALKNNLDQRRIPKDIKKQNKLSNQKAYKI